MNYLDKIELIFFGTQKLMRILYKEYANITWNMERLFVKTMF